MTRSEKRVRSIRRSVEDLSTELPETEEIGDAIEQILDGLYSLDVAIAAAQDVAP